jgi:Icc-related predicted phosphoesterase
MKDNQLKIIVISDTHGHHSEIQIPDGDVLIHCGDIVKPKFGSGKRQIREFNEYVGDLPHKFKLYSPGNHELMYMNLKMLKELLSNMKMLIDDELYIEGFSFFGYCGVLPKLIHDVDVLLSHEPPFGILDNGHGDKQLLDSLNIFRPKYHFFGHVHSRYGIFQDGITTFVNTSICDERYKPKNGATVMYL